MVVIKDQTNTQLVLSPTLIIVVLLSPLLLLKKGTVLLFINSFHNPILDSVFVFLSAIGNGVTIVICALLVLLFFKLRYFFQLLLSFAIQLILVIVFKQVVFNNMLRPYRYFNLNKDGILNLVKGVKVYTVDTFPSGHTATIFFLVTFFILMFNNKKVTWLLFSLGLFVGLSRVYLVQHFFIDVYFGLIFGVLSSILAYYSISRKSKFWFNYYFTSLFNRAKEPSVLEGNFAKA